MPVRSLHHDATGDTRTAAATVDLGYRIRF